MKKAVIGILIALGVGALIGAVFIIIRLNSGYSSLNGKPTETKVDKKAEAVKADYKDNNDEYYIPMPTKVQEPEIKCSFCGTKKSIYSETYDGKEIHLCNQDSCSEQYSDYRNHNNDIANYQKLIDVIEMIPDQDFFENIKDNVYEVKITNSEFTVTENDKKLVYYADNDFLNWLSYQLGTSYKYELRTRLNATTYQIKVDFPNNEITRVSEPVQSEYQPK